MAAPIFAHGQMRLYLLTLLAESPMHGYELMQAIEQRFDGTYVPSAGTIYPRLAKLADDGLITKRTVGRKTVYEITDEGGPSWTGASRRPTGWRTTSTRPCIGWPISCAPTCAAP